MRNYSYFLQNVYCIASGCFALLVFIHAFLPITDRAQSFAKHEDIPSSIGAEKVNISEMYHSHVDRTIVMVIDAFRVDFINDLNGIFNMPYTYSLLQKKEAFMVIGNVQTPTVTMPRIKAMTTGTVPSFIDVVYNLGSNTITDDNFIQQAENSGMSVVFYGDETWLKLFPTNFKRKEGTTSFFVTDFTEVDDNVTRNLEDELKVSDWKIMLLHYLGLDHIGHLEGPRSALVRPKLLEMDLIVEKIHYNMMEWSNKSSQKTILVLCGDHGMKDSGGHGGATTAETTVPIITVGLRQPLESSSNYRSVSQIDLVSTLSVLLGLPIPKGNFGKLIPQFLQNFDMKEKLYALYYNAKQLADEYNKINMHDSRGAILMYEEAVKFHVLWINSSGQTPHNAAKAEELYVSSLKSMSDVLSISRTAYDTFCLVIAICIEIQICIILLFQKCLKRHTLSTSQILMFALIFSFLNILYCLFTESDSSMCSFKMGSVLRIVGCIVIFAVNISGILNSWSDTLYFKMEANKEMTWFSFGSGLHLVSLLSSSFIEEEHQVWYFIWLSFLIVITWKECQYSYYTGHFKSSTICVSLSLTVCHRILRKLNQTGDKWAFLPDISDWLLLPHNKGFITLIFIFGLVINCVVLVYCSKYILEQGRAFKLIELLLNSSCFFVIYLYRASTGAVIKLFDTIDSKGSEEAKLFWCLFFLLIVKQIVFSLSKCEKNKISIIGDIISLCTMLWMLLTSLLHRPHNVLLPGVQGYASLFLGSLYRRTSKTRVDTCWLTIAHCWLGMVFYFYQGNSNSLATIDVASGYVGLQDYNPALVGVFLTVNTFAAPIFSLFLLTCQLFIEAKKQGIFWLMKHMEFAFHALICYRLCTVTLYLILMAFQRHHLFVWTVFSPKLLYESMYTVVQFVFILLMYAVLFSVEKLCPSILKENKAY